MGSGMAIFTNCFLAISVCEICVSGAHFYPLYHCLWLWHPNLKTKCVQRAQG